MMPHPNCIRMPCEVNPRFFPIVLFFAVYKFTNDLIVATLVLIPATLIQVVISYLMTKKVEPMPLVTLALVVI